MNTPTHAWWDFGYAGIFACVFLEQIGAPIPAFPALLAAGALVISGELNLGWCLVVAVAAALLADIIWYNHRPRARRTGAEPDVPALMENPTPA